MKKNITSKADALLKTLLFLIPAILGCGSSMENEKNESSDVKIEMVAMLVDSYCDCLKEKNFKECDDKTKDKLDNAMRSLMTKDLMGDPEEVDKLLTSSELKKLEEKYKKCTEDARKK